MNSTTASNPSKPNKKRKTSHNPETTFLINLQSCTKSKDLQSAISLYESALSLNLRLSLDHFNALLYLCSNSATDQLKDTALNHGFRIFEHMLSNRVTPNEASVTSVARLAAIKNDGCYAFELIKRMNNEYNVVPRLRTYDPALFCFCENLEADKAYEVEEHMALMGVVLEEQEIAALLKVSALTGRGEKVYQYLHKLRSSVRWVSEEAGKIIEEWFCSENCCKVKGVKSDVDLLKKAVSKNGGGWHGLGWIGEGKWVVKRGNVNECGLCCCCGEQLACVDSDDVQTEKFAHSIAGLAMEREVKKNFREFQDWLEKHANYEAIVDGANIGLYQQNFEEGGFSIPQLDAVVKELYNRSGNKWPLVILHNKRLRLLLENPSYRNLVEDWMDKGVIYLTPHGSNDDWYWLYAAVKLRCLLITNDEMRDHIFELLGSSFFLRWKERHQVHYAFVKGNLKLQMPPRYSFIIQESEKGSWHVPMLVKGDNESSQSWLCISRSMFYEPHDEPRVNGGTSENDHLL